MYESIIIRGVLLVLGIAGVYVGYPRLWDRALSPERQTVSIIVFMCGMFAIIGAVFAK